MTAPTFRSGRLTRCPRCRHLTDHQVIAALAILDAADREPDEPDAKTIVFRALQAHVQPLDVARAASVTGLPENVVRDALIGLTRDGRARLVPGKRFALVYQDTAD